MNQWRDLLKSEEGAAMPEYALLVALVALVAIVGARQLGQSINARLNTVATAVGTAGP